ncbi:MAG: HD domain-containing protein [Alphaproteobacteria bacterium]|nr:HD domain-containing protein [Alphaproteobacteria bacterium]
MSLSGHVALIAVIDSNPVFRNEVAQALISLYRVSQYDDTDQALQGLRRETPSVILVDEQAVSRGGLQFIADLKRDPILADVPAILTTRRDPLSIAQAMRQCGADTSLTKPFRRSMLIHTITSLVNKSVEANWEMLPERDKATLKGTVSIFNNISDFIAAGEPVPFTSVKQACEPLIDAIGKNDFKGILSGVKEHDNYSYAHSLRVATLLSLFGHTLGLKHEDQLVLASGGLLHDAGKISIPHEVLNKPGRLSEDEFLVMKSHVIETIKFLEVGPDIPKPVIIIAAQHHEKLDGTGYPGNLKGAELNDLARMASIVDVFSALTDRRVYKPPMEAEEALSIMTHEMGHHLDQHFVAMFREMLMDAVVD